MTAMFVEGVIFILITFLNVREVILNSIPMNLRFAISAGIGMFIAFVGLKNAGIIVPNPATFVMFGPFTPVSILAMVGILLSGILVLRKVKGALFYSILICTLIGIPLGVTKFRMGSCLFPFLIRWRQRSASLISMSFLRWIWQSSSLPCCL